MTLTARQRSAAVHAAASFLHMQFGVCRDRATPLAARLIDQALAAAAATPQGDKA